MKKIICTALSLVLTACSIGPDKKDDFTYLVFATPLQEHTIWLQAKEGFEAACSDNKIMCDWMGPSVIDTQEMENVIKTAVLQKADAIITQGVISQSLIDSAYEKNIPILLVDSDVPSSQRFAYMGKDFHEQATLLMRDIESRYGKETPLKIAIQVAEKSFSIAQTQIREIEAVFQMHEAGFEIVTVSESKSDPVRAKKEWNRVLSEYPDINVTISLAAESAELCAEWVVENDRKKDVLIYGVDDMPSTIKMIKEGKIDGSVATSFYDYGYRSVEMLLDYIRYNKRAEEKILSPSLTIINKETVDTYEKK